MALPASLPVVTVEGPVYRCHPIAHGYMFFGKSASYRFDDPLGLFGVLYLGKTREAAFAETCLRNVDATLVSESFLAKRAMIQVVIKPVTLLQAYGPGLAKIGQTALISASSQDEYPLTQAFSREVHEHPDKVSGIAYKSRHDNDQLCVALFERAVGALPVPPDQKGERMLTSSWIWDLMETYGVGLDVTS
ncbi:MAG: RES family NAD+ phosphorylase [Inquilinus sp.]|uniref:RES family NAD+ phosphorylase n=1 Tax=Inquilinus sp. TaxID=1932117 RepID=UPI003F2B915F